MNYAKFDFLKFVNIFSQFRNHFSLEKGGALHLKKLTSLTPRMLCAKFGWNGPVVLEKKLKMWKVYDNDNIDNDNDNNDDDGQRTNFDLKRSLEPSAQVS